jgi:hypothetical protein
MGCFPYGEEHLFEKYRDRAFKVPESAIKIIGPVLPEKQ